MEQIFALFTIFLALTFSGKSSDAFNRYDFPEGFVFGAGTSAYQWEGAVAEDGRKPSTWDTLCHSRNVDNGDIACDGYHKYKEDVKLMVDTGLDASRFSISWSRLIPYGRGPVNQKGLQFYKNLIQELVRHGIEPHVTLYHYEHPQFLEDEYGGWLNHRMIKDFTAYADVCFREFGNQVKFWTTINEANVFSIEGYTEGVTPPGHCSIPGRTCLSGNSSIETYMVGHNLLLAHASASRLYKQKYKSIQGGSVGFGLSISELTPATSSKNDAIATQRAKDFFVGWFLEPLTFGDYPDAMKRSVGSRLPVFSEEESEQVKGSSDFIGINHYYALTVTNIKSSPSEIPAFYSDMGANVTYLGNSSVADKYPIAPWSMEGVLEYVKQSYGNPPVYILENGKPMKQQIQQGWNTYMLTLVLCSNPLGMDQTREATLYGHLWIYTSFLGDTRRVLGCTLSISAILISRDLLDSLLNGTLIFSRAKTLLLAPKASRNCRATSLLPPSGVAFIYSDEYVVFMRRVINKISCSLNLAC